MSNVAEIEAAIEKLPETEFKQLMRRLEEMQQQRQEWEATYQAWLAQAAGAAIPGVRTDDIMALTRGDA